MKVSACRVLMCVAIILSPIIARADRTGLVAISGLVPQIAFAMKDSETGKTVTAADFRGKIVMVFFGYTNCTDECPDTLATLHQVLLKMGKAADKMVLLFVTIDPARDTLPVLNTYLAAFDPHFVGLRGNSNQIYRLTRRYRVVATVHPSPDPAKYEVVHSALTYVFGTHGNARFIIPDITLTPHPDIRGIADRLKQLETAKSQPGWLSWFANLG